MKRPIEFEVDTTLDSRIHIRVTKLDDSPHATITDHILVGEQRKGHCSIDTLPAKGSNFVMTVYEKNGIEQHGKCFCTSPVYDIRDFHLVNGHLESIEFETLNSIYLLEVI